jgi:hypothetical protein
VTWYRNYFEDGCRDCGGSGKPEPLYLHARCHMDSKADGKLVIEHHDDGQHALIELSCCECSAPVGSVAIETPPLDIQRVMLHHGHDDSSRTYLYFEGDLFIMCDECRQPVAILAVKEAQ